MEHIMDFEVGNPRVHLLFRIILVYYSSLALVIASTLLVPAALSSDTLAFLHSYTL